MTATIEVDIVGKDDASGVLGNIGGAFANLGSIVSGIRDAFDLVSGAIEGVIKFGEQFIEAASGSEQAVSRLNTVLASTGGTIGLTSSQLQDMATNMMNLAGFSDEAEMSAETMLLRFENLNGIFPQALQLTNDFARSLGVDLTAAAQTIGKALDDPASGIGRLNMQFKLFDQTEMDNIKTMAEHGQLAEAQALIMERLTEKVGGAADAFGNTFAGKLAIAKENLDNLKEAIGNAFLPALSNLLEGVTDFIQSPAVQDFITKFSASIGDITNKVADFLIGLQDNTNLLAVVDAVQSFVFWLNFTKDPLEAFDKTLSSIGANGGPLANIAGFISAIRDAMKSGDWTFIDTWIAESIANIDWAGLGKSLGDAIVNLFSEANLKSSVVPSPTSATGTAIGNAFKDFFAGVFGQIGGAVGDALSKWWDSLMLNLRAKIRTSYWDIKVDLANLGTNIMDGIIEGMNNWRLDWNAWWNEHLVTPVKQFFGIASPSTLFMDIGKNIIQGLINGFESGIDLLKAAILVVAEAILGPLKPILDLLGINITLPSGGTTSPYDKGSTEDFPASGGTGTLTGTAGITNNFYGAVYVGSMQELYDCPPNMFIGSTSTNMVPLHGQ